MNWEATTWKCKSSVSLRSCAVWNLDARERSRLEGRLPSPEFLFRSPARGPFASWAPGDSPLLSRKWCFSAQTLIQGVDPGWGQGPLFRKESFSDATNSKCTVVRYPGCRSRTSAPLFGLTILSPGKICLLLLREGSPGRGEWRGEKRKLGQECRGWGGEAWRDEAGRQEEGREGERKKNRRFTSEECSRARPTSSSSSLPSPSTALLLRYFAHFLYKV